MKTANDLNTLAQFIRQHDGCEFIGLVSAGQIAVESDAVIDGRVVRIEDTIGANMQSVRDWLGY